MDGQRVEMGPGEVSFGADQGTTQGKGHRSGTAGPMPCRMMIVQLGDRWKGARPGELEAPNEKT